MATSIFANTNGDPTAGAVFSEVYPVPVEIPTITRGNKITYNVYLVDGDGNFDAISGDTGYTLKIGVGPPGSTAYATVTFTTQITNGWSGVLDLTTQAVIDALAGAASVVSTWELQVTEDATSQSATYIQQPVQVINRVNT